jgi:hypothetical protein
VATEEITQLDLAEQISRIRRAQVETDKFAAEQRKLSEEASNMRVVRWVAPVSALLTPIAASIAAFGALVAAAPVLRHWLGG